MASLRKLGEASQMLARAGVVLEDAPQADSFGEAAALVYAAFSTDMPDVLEDRRLEVLDKIPAHLRGDPEVIKFMDEVKGAGSLKAIQGLAKGLPTVLKEASERLSLENNLNDQQNREEMLQQQIKALWADVHEKEKDVEEKMRDAWARRDITQEQYDEWLKKHNAAQALADNDPRKVALSMSVDKMAESYLTNAADHAEGQGRHDHAENYRNGAQNAQDAQKDLEKIQKKYAEQKSARTQDTTQATQQISEDDDEPSLAQQKPSKIYQKEDVAEVGNLPSPQTPRSNIPTSRAIG